MIARLIIAAIRPYSIAVAPSRELTILRNVCFTAAPQPSARKYQCVASAFQPYRYDVITLACVPIETVNFLGNGDVSQACALS